MFHCHAPWPNPSLTLSFLCRVVACTGRHVMGLIGWRTVDIWDFRVCSSWRHREDQKNLENVIMLYGELRNRDELGGFDKTNY